ncbi:MAG TPA: DUF5995 family protein, partial [Thermoanaerobaculia bacterium]|nr:DUF5995 family protein [Thermoanaerobaculia bacterium]
MLRQATAAFGPLPLASKEQSFPYMLTPLPPLPAVTTIDQVVGSIEKIIAWSIVNESRLGYFAALYKRITLAVKSGIADHQFEDGPRMEKLDVTFASRYFAALNGYFHPGDFPAISHCWRIAFEGALLPGPIIIQQMVVGVNAHIGLDLGIAAEAVAPGPLLPSLHHDFNAINAVLASQVTTVVSEIDSLSPVLADVYAVLMKNELDLIADGLVVVRDNAWLFARSLSLEPAILHRSAITLHDLDVARLGSLILHPPLF